MLRQYLLIDESICTRGHLIGFIRVSHVLVLLLTDSPSSFRLFCSTHHIGCVMAPSAIDPEPAPAVPDITNGVKKLLSSSNKTSNLKRAPLVYSGSLDEYDSFDVANVIGKEFPDLQLSEILDDDQKIRDLAILGKSYFHVSD